MQRGPASHHRAVIGPARVAPGRRWSKCNTTILGHVHDENIAIKQPFRIARGRKINVQRKMIESRQLFGVDRCYGITLFTVRFVHMRRVSHQRRVVSVQGGDQVADSHDGV